MNSIKGAAGGYQVGGFPAPSVTPAAGGQSRGTLNRSDVDPPDQRSIEWILSAVIVRITLTWSLPPYHW
jgi:hypothetical protein